jgi:outer membrane protein TolC
LSLARARGWLAGALLLALANPLAAKELPVVNVGVMVDGPWERNDYMRQLNIDEISTLTAGEFDVRFPDEAYLIGDWTYQTAEANLERLLRDPEVDVILAWGVLSSQAVCCYVDLPKPVVAPVILDPKLQSLPLEDGASGVRNLSYVEIENKVVEELELFRQIVPFKKIYFLSNGNFVSAIPDLAARTFELAAQAGYEVELVPVNDSVEEALAAIPEDAEAVYMWPQFQLSIEQRQRLIDGLEARKLPSFSGLDMGDVEAGVLASATDIEFFQRLVRRVALNVQRILLGENAGRLPVLFSSRLKVTINMATARAIGVSPGWDVMVEARVLFPEEEGLPEMTLERAVSEAVEANLDLAVQRRVVSAGAQDIPLARSDYLPQLGAGLQGLQIDEDRAVASFGSQPERSTSGSLSLSQLLYSDPVLANIQVQRELQKSREEEFESIRLDIALDAATTYLNLLRARSLVSIQRSNLEVTRSNLDLARIRRTIGAANPAEVFRWEAQIAADRKSLVEARADQRAAEIALNRLLHRDLEEVFSFGEVELDDPSLITGQDRFQGYTDTPERFRLLRDFMVQEGLTVSPELRQLDATIRAQERALLSAKRAYWAPTVALEATLDEIFSRHGAGAEPVDLGLGDLVIPAADDTSWSVGLGATLPLYSGGARKAQVIQAEEDLSRINLLLDSVAQQIATRIRVGMELARASFAGIELSDQASVAAGKSLELVSDAYARGAVSILDLLDAQNAAVSAEQLYANAVYDFFVDLMEVQRASNRFDFFLSAADRDLWYERLEDYFDRAGARPLETTEAGQP